jgi:D-alanyl-D-alanine carboxypeptidase (penicillin-binding protein 5/6)
MARTASARTTTRRTLRPIAVGLVVVTVAIIGTLVYQSASSSATSPPRPETAQASPVTPRNGPLGTIAWPASGVSAAGISGIGVLPGPGASQPVPIASVAKVMTAYIILRDHPLGAGEPGPAIVVQPGEAAAYPAQARNGDSLVAVSAGEQLTERQALEALLLPSADNMAWILARWDAGSQAAFTAQMNTTARRLGMTDTHYTDPSGLSASTTSTAADQVRLGMAAMSEPALAQIVALRSAVIPVAGVVRNYNTLLGQDGITGLKTGSDTAAGGCILLAAWQQARGHDTLIVATTFGQPGTMATMLPNALQAGHQLVLALGRALAGQSAQHIRGNKAGKHRSSWPLMAAGWTVTALPGSSARSPAAPGSPSPSGHIRCGMPSSLRRSTQGCRCETCRKRLPTPIREPPCATTGPARPWTATPPISSPPTSLARRDRSLEGRKCPAWPIQNRPGGR